MERQDLPRKLAPPLQAAEAIGCICDLCRAAWQLLAEGALTPITRDLLKDRGLQDAATSGLPPRPTEYAFVRQDLAADCLSSVRRIPPSFRAFVELRLERLGIAPLVVSPQFFQDESEYLLLHRDLLDPLRANLRVFEPLADPHDITFFVMRATRKYHSVSLCGETNRYFNVLAEALTAFLNTSDGDDKRQYAISELRDTLAAAALRAELSSGLALPDLFLECCRAANYFSLGRDPGVVWFYAKVADGEFLLARLFGLPSGISGFDKLFSSGGVLLVDTVVPRTPEDTTLPGRVLLTTGRSGTGKSILSLQIAAEVARKGGIAWYMPLEQSFAECAYTLESMGISLTDERFIVARNAVEAERLFERTVSDKGALVFLRHSSERYEEFIDLLTFAAERMSAYDLRLLILDPINAVVRSETDFSGNLRAVAVEALRRVRDAQVNVWINGEQDFEGEHDFFEQKIADTVLHLSLEDGRNRTQRYIEVRKSRLQRERRGYHPYQIVPEHGIRVHLAPHAWTAALRGRAIRPPDRFTTFGVPGIDGMLGIQNLSVFDLVVLQGPTGSLKTIAGLMFLLANSRKAESSSRALARSLLVTDRSSVSINSLLMQIDPKPHKPVDILIIETGDIQPGELLGRIDQQFELVRREGHFYDRVMVDNLSRWEVSCPLLRENDEFGVALVEYFRRHSVTTLFTCGGTIESEGASLLQRSVIDGSDCIIRCYLYELQGRLAPFLRILKSRTGRHRTDLVEVRLKAAGIEVSNSPIPFRPGPSGTLIPVDVRLILHSESPSHDRYNALLVNQLRSTISRNADVVQRSMYPQALLPELPEVAGIEEVQVLQLDEYEITAPTEGRLYAFETGRSAEGLLPRLKRKLDRSGPGIVPFYLNISLLMYDRTHFEACDECLNSWAELAERSSRWENEARDNIFLDCVLPSEETYNCCFLEVLFDGEIDDERRISEDWLTCGAKSVLTSLEQFWQLFHRAHQLRASDCSSSTGGLPFLPQARFWRHWFSTIALMLPRVDLSRRRNLGIRPNIGNLSVAGDWYIGVPAKSELPELGARIVRSIATRDEEVRRFYMGVGLPNFASFYRGVEHQESHIAEPSRAYPSRPELYQIAETAIERSCLANYARFRGTLAYHLLQVLDIPEPDGTVGEFAPEEIRWAARDLVDEFRRMKDEGRERARESTFEPAVS